MKLMLLFAGLFTMHAQDPYTVAGNHYRLAFENPWVRATRVVYGPHETAAVHNHPPNPVTVYIYVTDGGTMQFHHVSGAHVAGFTIDRKPVRAGAIRVAHGAPETHSVKYLGDDLTEYARLELRTEPIDRPTRDVRLNPGQEFENGQLRIVRVHCSEGHGCPSSEHPGNPAVTIIMSGPRRGEMLWAEAGQTAAVDGPVDLVRVELKSRPVKHD
jgi:hypothetical protein